MATPVSIDQLPAVTSLSSAAAVAIVQNGVTYRTTPAAFINQAESFLQSGSSRTRSVQDVLRDTVLLTNYAVCDGTTNDTTALLQAISDVTEGGTIICPPGHSCLVSPDAFTLGAKVVHFFCPGSGKRINSQAKQAFRFLASAGGGYFFKYSNLQTSTANLDLSLELNGINFDGGGFTFSDAVVVLEGISAVNGVNSSICNATGVGLRMREVFEPYFHRFAIASIDAGAANGVVVFDSRYNSDNNLNVNNCRFHLSHFEANNGPYFFAASDANLDVLEITGSKFEWGLSGVPAAGPWSLFEIRQASRVNIHGNHFTNFKNANKYDNLFEMGFASTACLFAIHDNDFSGLDSSTVGLNAIGGSRGDFYDNRSHSSSSVIPTFSITSTDRVNVEPMRNLDTGVTALGSDNNKSYLRMVARASASGHAAISCHDIQNAQTSPYVADANAKNLTGTVIQSGAGTNTDIARVPLHLFAGAPCGLRIGVRCRSTSGAGTLKCQVNTTNSADQTATVAYSTLWFEIPRAMVQVMGDSASDRFKFITGAANGEAVFIDEIYLLPLPNLTVSADVGNAGVTLTVGSSKNIIIYNTAITADRAVALSTTNASDGDTFRVVRTANATGAFNVNVGTGPLKAMGTAGSFCDVTYNGNTAAWMLTAYGVL